MKNLYLLLLELQSTGKPLILATITRTPGSFLHKPGSSILFNSNGFISESAGDNFLDTKIREIAFQSFSTGKSGYFCINPEKEMSKVEDDYCEGSIEILMDASPLDHISVFEEIKRSLERRIPGVLVTKITRHPDNDQVSIERTWMPENNSELTIQNGIPGKEIKRLSGGGYSQYCEFKIPGSEGLIFLEPIFPLPHLIIAGAGNICKALMHIARLLDFEITVIDDREEFANRDNLPDADHIIVRNAGEILEEMDLTPDTYVVIGTKGYKDDALALRPCIGGEAAYLGIIGSRNKISWMRDEFIRKGWAEPREWKDIHAPVGMDIFPGNIQEIAVSIAAQLIQVKNSKIQPGAGQGTGNFSEFQRIFGKGGTLPLRN